MGIRIIGCGAMGSAFAHQLSKSGQKISLYDKDKPRAEKLASEVQGKVCAEPLEKIGADDFLLLAIKPQDLPAAASQLQDFSGSLIMSILAGVTMAQLQHYFRSKPILRMMPNLAVKYGNGVIALVENPALLPLKERIEATLKPLGYLHWFPEASFNAVTALTGSGPAFIFSLIEAMVDAAVAMGLPAESGLTLTQQMIEGSLTTLKHSNGELSSLKWQVTSPSGTTIAGIREFEKNKVRSGVMETFLAAYRRAIELGEKNQ